jgi:hypothetical protein
LDQEQVLELGKSDYKDTGMEIDPVRKNKDIGVNMDKGIDLV